MTTEVQSSIIINVRRAEKHETETRKKINKKLLRKLLTKQKKFDIISISNKEKIKKRKRYCVMENTKKITKREYFEAIAEFFKAYDNILVNNIPSENVIEFCEKEIETLKHKSQSKKMTKIQVENESIKEEILSLLETIEKVTVSEIVSSLSETYSNQKITQLMTQMLKAGKVSRTVEKKVAYFSKA